jgi:transposase
MIPEAREVRLKPKMRKVLEARCRAPTTPQRGAQRARIVLLAAEGRSTRSIAAQVGVQPRIVSKWRHRFADHGLDGLKDRPRASKKPIYGVATNKRILALLDRDLPQPWNQREPRRQGEASRHSRLALRRRRRVSAIFPRDRSQIRRANGQGAFTQRVLSYGW